MGNANKAIRTEADAVAWLKERGRYEGLDVVEKDGTSYVVLSAACWKCGGGGWGSWYPDGGRCYACGGAYTKDRKKRVSLKRYAQAEKAAARRREKAAEDARVFAERMLEGQRRWCEKHGYGRITFEERDAQRAAEREAAKAKSGHIGKLKERRDFTATIVAIPTWDGFAYNTTTYCHILVDDDGNKLVWKTTDNGFCVGDGGWAGVGDRVTFKATVKEHGERNGEKQTVVTRAKAIAIEEKAEEAA